MTVYRKIYKCRTVGSKAEGNLRPEIVDRLPTGINCCVLEYNEAEGWAIVEFFCSDHPLLEEKFRKGRDDLERLRTDPSVIETLATHPNSPPVLGGFAIRPELAEAIDETAGEVMVRGVRAKFVRKSPEPRIGLIIDEG